MKISLKKLHQCLGAMILLTSAVAMAQTASRPNIIMIMADDIGPANVGIYTHGLMVPTPNIDRLAKEGMLFTDHYAEPSCTSGRAAFITGQMPIRTGLDHRGLARLSHWHRQTRPYLAEILKSKGYRTAHFGKSHLGDRDEHLPHNHGFDEFFGNLYHLNAEEEPEQRDYPTQSPDQIQAARHH
jgi:arylsulfatase A-like enzyme